MREVFGGVRALTILTADLGAARAFWTRSMGLAVMKETPGRSVVVNAGTFRLRLEVVGPGAEPTRGVILSFRVENLAETAGELDGRDVAYACRTHRVTGDYLEVSDPQGNRVRFTERV